MPVDEYQSRSDDKSTYSIAYGAGWYIISRAGKVLKHVSSALGMGLAGEGATERLTLSTAQADVDNNFGVNG
jgi:hypothetical protein